MIASLVAGLVLGRVPSLHLDPYLVGRGSHHAMDLAVTRLTKDHIRAGIEESRYAEPAWSVNGRVDAKRAVAILRKVHIKGLILFDPPKKVVAPERGHPDQSAMAPDMYRIGKGTQSAQMTVMRILAKQNITSMFSHHNGMGDVLVIGRTQAVRAVSILRSAHLKDLTLRDNPEKIFYYKKSFSGGPATGN